MRRLCLQLSKTTMDTQTHVAWTTEYQCKVESHGKLVMTIFCCILSQISFLWVKNLKSSFGLVLILVPAYDAEIDGTL